MKGTTQMNRQETVTIHVTTLGEHSSTDTILRNTQMGTQVNKMGNQTTDTILMIRPARFCFNTETATTNSFQMLGNGPSSEKIQELALREFNTFVECLRKVGITAVVINDTIDPVKPDAIFPNNWFSTHRGNNRAVLVIYPMLAENRRPEIREDIIASLIENYGYEKLDLRRWCKKNEFLEGTGSIVFDKKFKRAYASLSERTDEKLVLALCEELDFVPMIFNTSDNGESIYHTNMILSIGENFAVFCPEVIPNKIQRDRMSKSLQTGREVIFINKEQVRKFAGNIIQLKNLSGEYVLVLSETGMKSLSDEQIDKLFELNHHILCPIIPTIETIGGGGARCMIAEIF
jgi:hypothetical protein